MELRPVVGLAQSGLGVGPEIVGSRDSPDTRRLLELARVQRLPCTWIDPPRRPTAGLEGEQGQLRAVTLADGECLPFSFLFLFLGANPCTEWLGDVLAREADGSILTGADARAEGLLETSVPGVFAVGDVRAGSIKRCATAVGEGATVVQLAHERMRRLAGSPGLIS